MIKSNNEKAVKACYSTWGETYYDEYYSPKASYPPVHSHLLKALLIKEKVEKLLDAGCGPASFLRELTDTSMDLYGFDLTPEMVSEARKVFEGIQKPADHLWEGSVLSPESYRQPGAVCSEPFDGIVCVGVLPHIPAEADMLVLANLRNAVGRNGLVVIGARNQLFSLFTLNRYSCQFFMDELIRAPELLNETSSPKRPLEEAFEGMRSHFRMDLPPVRKGKCGEPGYDEVLSRSHNPLKLKEQLENSGFKDVQLLFYHYHCLPPMFADSLPDFFLQRSIAMEDPNDWRGYFMASAFLIAGRKI